MKPRIYYGDKRLEHKVVYDTCGLSDCIYCGNPADSREHVPSKTFLKKPYPPNLYLVPACRKCNNAFSADELYMWIVIKYLEELYGNDIKWGAHEKDRYQKYKNIVSTVSADIEAYAKKQSGSTETSVFDFNSKRIERVIKKLALGHAVYELSEGYNIGEGNWTIEKTLYAFLPILSQDTIEDYSSAVFIQNAVFPEVGSRIYEQMFTVAAREDANEYLDMLLSPQYLLDWIVIQGKTYRYITIFTGGIIQVNIVIDEFLFASVFFKYSNNDEDCSWDFGKLMPSENDCKHLRNIACILED